MSLQLGNLVSTGAALAVVLGLVLLAARGLRTAGFTRAGPARGRSDHRLTVQDSLFLDRARRLVVVRCDGRDLLLVTGGGTDLVVGWLPPAESLEVRP